MASVSYETIFSNFLGDISDPTLANLSMSEAYGLMTEYLHKVVAQSYVRRIFKSLELHDTILVMDYEMNHSVNNSDEDFVIYVLSKGMVVEWLQPQVKSKVNIAQFFSGKESKFFSQSNHISELRAMLDDTQRELRNAIRDRGYIYNSYLENK